MSLSTIILTTAALATAMAEGHSQATDCRVEAVTVRIYVVPRRWWHSLSFHTDWQREWVGCVA
jgi:hypothetical protein